MKKDHQSIQTRQNGILDLLEEKKVVSIAEMTAQLNVSLMTIRRDLQILENQGKLVRFRGGARAVGTEELPESALVSQCRRRISQFAAGLVKNKDILLINGSQTAIELLDYIQEKHVKVLTNNARAASLPLEGNISIYLTGGQLRDHTMVGDLAIRSVLDVKADRAFLGCSGISQNGEIQCTIPSEISVNGSMITHASEYYVLADHTKLGKNATSASFFLETPGTVITDWKAPQPVVEKLCHRGMKVIVVDEAGRGVYQQF